MSEMFRRGEIETLGRALRGSQQVLMDNADTSHPYYWAGFAIIGDAARQLLAGGRNRDIAAIETDDAVAE